MKTQHLILFAALTMSLQASLPAFAGPIEEDPTTSECATNQPELRKIFATEMDILKSFEGSWQDNSGSEAVNENLRREGKQYDPKNASAKSRAYSYNANKKGIEIQFKQTGDDIRQRKVNKPIKVKICKTRMGAMRVLGDGIEIDLQVLSNLQVLIREGKSWRRFHRLNTVHGVFEKEQNTLDQHFEPVGPMKALPLDELLRDPTQGIN